MKKYMSKFFILTLSILVSSAVQAGSVTNTFNTDDVLTAAQMTNIKNAVNDNDTNISSFFGGDGSAGALTVSSNTNWESTPPTDFNLNFTDCTIDPAIILTIPSGVTIRCSGDFVNSGTINVSPNVRAGAPTGWGNTNETTGTYSIGHPGDSSGPASGGSHDGDGVDNFMSAGNGGKGITQLRAATSFSKFQFGGGSGAGGFGTSGIGGGLTKIYVGGTLTNAGTITADGSVGLNAQGGGAGGIIILASLTTIDNDAGTITADGGSGGASYSFGGSGGGGGGGIVILASPVINNTTGVISLLGGSAGASTVDVTASSKIAGGGGGASGGAGGNGGSVSSTDVASSGGSGNGGYILELVRDPFYLIH